MYTFSAPLGEAEGADGKGDFAFHIYGQAAALNKELPAAEVMRRLVEETTAAFSALSAGLR